MSKAFLDSILEVTQEDFIETTKIKIDISSDPVRLIIKAFDINDDEKGKKIFYIINDMYSRKFTTQEAINQIEKGIDKLEKI